MSSGVRRPGPSCVPGSAEAGSPGAPSRDAGSGGPGDPGAHGVTVGTKAGAWHLSRRSGDLGLYVNGSRWTSERPSDPLCGGQDCLALIAKSGGRMEGLYVCTLEGKVVTSKPASAISVYVHLTHLRAILLFRASIKGLGGNLTF